MKRIKLKTTTGVLLIICVLFLTGCWGKREVEDLAPLIGVGFDLGKKPGTYVITEQFAQPKKGELSGATSEGRTMSIDALSGRDAYEKIAKIFYRKPFMGSLKVIIIGEDVAKAGFKDILDFTQRFGEFRRSMYLVVAKGKAQDILNMEMRAGKITTMYIKDNIETGDAISTYPEVPLGHYLTVLGRKSMAPIIPLISMVSPGTGGVVEYNEKSKAEASEIILEGAGVFRGDRLVDYLTDKETKGYMWLDNHITGRFITTVGSEERKITFGGAVLKSTTKYKVADIDGTVGVQYQIKASMAIDEVLGLTEQLSETEYVEFIKGAEQSFAEVIQEECELSIKKEKELGLDFLGIGRHLEQKNPKYWKTVKDQWEKEIANFPISLDVQVKINNSGMSSGSPTTK